MLELLIDAETQVKENDIQPSRIFEESDKDLRYGSKYSLQNEKDFAHLFHKLSFFEYVV